MVHYIGGYKLTVISSCINVIDIGAIAAVGAGMLGGNIAVVGSAGFMDKKNTIMQSAKLLTFVREIF